MVGADLLDVSALVALFWEGHTAHDVARRWFHKQGEAEWATCALTQCGFVRIVSNRAFSRDAVTPAQALAQLEMNLAQPGHKFWPMNLGAAEAIKLSGIAVEGHQQVTDLYLIGLAVKHGGRLVTFDKALKRAGKHVVVL